MESSSPPSSTSRVSESSSPTLVGKLLRRRHFSQSMDNQEQYESTIVALLKRITEMQVLEAVLHERVGQLEGKICNELHEKAALMAENQRLKSQLDHFDVTPLTGKQGESANHRAGPPLLSSSNVAPSERVDLTGFGKVSDSFIPSRWVTDADVVVTATNELCNGQSDWEYLTDDDVGKELHGIPVRNYHICLDQDDCWEDSFEPSLDYIPAQLKTRKHSSRLPIRSDSFKKHRVTACQRNAFSNPIDSFVSIDPSNRHVTVIPPLRDDGEVDNHSEEAYCDSEKWIMQQHEYNMKLLIDCDRRQMVESGTIFYTPKEEDDDWSKNAFY